MKRILLLNASAKNNGATEEILSIIKKEICDSYIVDSFCLGDLNISYCKGCKSCYKTCKCTQNDDVDVLISAMDSADIFVICAPSYWGDVPGQFKVFIDRCTVYSNTNPNPNRPVLKSGKKCYGIALRTGLRAMECEHIIECIHHWCGHMEVEMADSLYFCGINNKKDITIERGYIVEKCNEWFA
jgi:multimeric flavodoxin WrbA